VWNFQWMTWHSFSPVIIVPPLLHIHSCIVWVWGSGPLGAAVTHTHTHTHTFAHIATFKSLIKRVPSAVRGTTY
jgi:hypothetical protein